MVPPTPGNGPGAPPPEPNSPLEPNYEEELRNALRRENELRAIGDSNNANGNVEDDDDGEEDEHMGEDNIDEPVYHLPPPPEAIYPNEIELEKAMHAWSLEHGYELVRRASKRNAAKQLYKRYFHCSKHGKASSTAVRKEDRKRMNRTSNRMNCPMSLAAVAVDPHDPTGNWQIRHRKTYHNHPAIDVVHLAGHRRRARNPAVEAAVDGLFAIGTNVGDVLKFLQRTNPDGLFKRTDVANMKLKYKKYGTCSQRGDEQQPAERQGDTLPAGVSLACAACRVKKTQCNNVRPMCGTCVASDSACHYEYADASGAGPADEGATTLGDISRGDEGVDNAPLSKLRNTMPSLANVQNAAQASRVLAALNSFQAEHVRPTRLTLESSAVEILAATTCGNGESYRSAVPRPFSFGEDYSAFKEAFMSAAIKENTKDVLIGTKREPLKPVGEEGGEVTLEEHNEYIKQLAIYQRRNDMLKAGLRETVTKALWIRIQKCDSAREAWATIEDLCMPRGSDQAFARFSKLQNVTLEGSAGNFDAYVFELRRLWEEFNEMAACHDSRRAPAALSQSAAEMHKRRAGGDGAFPEELLCFLFLTGLGPRYQGMALDLTRKCNVGGYGSGERCTFKDLTMMVKRNLEGDSGRGRGRGATAR